MNMPILTFAGRIASGKSTLSQALADRLKWPRVSFGEYIRDEAHQRGLSTNRLELQRLGNLLISDGWEPLCREVLKFGKWNPEQPLIVDGIRHVEVVSTLREIAHPQKVLLIFIDIDENVRNDRLRTRGISNIEHMQDDKHPTEHQVFTTIPRHADLIVNGGDSIQISVSSIMIWLHTVIEGDSRF